VAPKSSASRALHEALRYAAARLRAGGLSEPEREARLLIRDLLELTDADLLLNQAGLLTESQLAALASALERRCRREPLAYIVGKTRFMRWDFIVGPAVMVPRPETEILVEVVAEHLSQPRRLPSVTVVDVGCGSGVIGCSLALLLPETRAILSDVSPPAVALARENVRRLGLDSRVQCVTADLLQGLQPPSPFALCANLPYVSAGEIETLQPEIARYEPRVALDGGPDGLRVIARLLEQVGQLQQQPRLLALEVGAGQAGFVSERLRGGPWQEVKIIKDYAGIERIVLAQ